MPSRPEGAPPVSVVAAIVVDDPATLAATLDAVRRQVYEPAEVVVVGGERDGRLVAEASGVPWKKSTSVFLQTIDGDRTHVWWLHSGAVPRPDALKALVEEAERNNAAIAGSKLLDLDEPERLVSVGVATDVFDHPYVGLDPDEKDQGQYDVVRDVAAVVGASMLVRRDLLQGLGGPDPLLPPRAAAIDLCQRARLRGVRIIVVPSSEVLYTPEVYRDDSWREEAGRIRAMIKVYGPVTLLWALPGAFLVGMVEAVVSPFLGRWTLFRWLRAWAWNLVRLPSTVRARVAARRGRVVDDAELFRYQLGGSVRLRSLWQDIGGRLQERIPGDEGAVATLTSELRRPEFVAGAVAAVVVLVASRRIWRDALPAVGWSLPLPPRGTDALAAYAGGWNPAGLGSPEPLRPIIGLAGAMQTLLLNRPGFTMALMVVGALTLGVWGMVRLLRTWDVGPVPGIAAGLVLTLGPVARALGDAGALPSLLALGVLPWGLRLAIARFPRPWPARLARLAATALTIGVIAALDPLVGLVPLVALMAWALLELRDRAAWRATLVAGVGTVAAVPLLMPWITHADLRRVLVAGAAYWEPGTVTVAIFGVGVALVALAARHRMAMLALWGGLLAVGGGLAARSGAWGPGIDVEHAGIAAASLGVAISVGAAFQAVVGPGVLGWRRFGVGLGAAAASVLVLLTSLAILPGRAGLPADQLDESLGFTVNREGDPAASRVLLVGPADALPGEARLLQGAAYRVVSAPLPALWEAWLPDMRAGDDALHATLTRLADGELIRAGEALAPFGIRWIVAMGDSPFTVRLRGQLDLIPLGGVERPTFESDAPNPVRAVTERGDVWVWTTDGYRGEPDPMATVRIAENAHPRWGPGPWSQVDWANEVSAAEGAASFTPSRSRRTQAVASGLLVAFLLIVVVWGRQARPVAPPSPDTSEPDPEPASTAVAA